MEKGRETHTKWNKTKVIAPQKKNKKWEERIGIGAQPTIRPLFQWLRFIHLFWPGDVGLDSPALCGEGASGTLAVP